jgi:hypothetical protein
MCDHCVLADMEVEHADIGEIGAIFKCELKALLRVYGTGSQDFKSNLVLCKSLICIFLLVSNGHLLCQKSSTGLRSSCSYPLSTT